MNRQEARSKIEYIVDNGQDYGYWTDAQKKALNMAIEALEQETVSRETYTHEYCLRKEFEMKVFELEKKMAEQEPSEDCISREWVLKKFQKGKEKIYKSEYFDELMWLVKHAPNVVPKERIEK